MYLAAISACHDDGLEGPIGGHPLLSKLMKGVQHLRPAKARSVLSWDLDMVLLAVSKPPFEPLGLMFLKHLTIKV